MMTECVFNEYKSTPTIEDRLIAAKRLVESIQLEKEGIEELRNQSQTVPEAPLASDSLNYLIEELERVNRTLKDVCNVVLRQKGNLAAAQNQERPKGLFKD